ncbi:MAG: AAA domain-containing protein [Pseudomonadota bacterium]
MDPTEEVLQRSVEGNDLPIREGVIIDQRFKISGAGMSGGMSTVFPAVGLVDKCQRAIKISHSESDRERSNLSFEREGRALADLSHQNIVKLIDKGYAFDIPYLALEWLPGGDLARRIQDSGPASWGDFYELIGRPLLSALTYAHQRRWAHRDLKPQNVLFDEDGTPKIVDFGIARNTNQPQLGLTFFQAGSPPYTPPEADDGYRSEQRDLYSWAAIAVSCLAGSVFRTADDMLLALEALRETAAPRTILRTALSQLAGDRYRSASLLLADLDTYHAAAIEKAQAPIYVFLEIGEFSIQSLRTEFPALNDSECISYIVADLNTAWSAFCDQQEKKVQIFGATIRVRCEILEQVLRVEHLVIHTPDRARELREENPTIAGVKFFSGAVRDYRTARDGLRNFINRLEVVDSARAQAAEAKRREKWFDCWAAFLRERERGIKVKQKEFVARRIDEEDEFFVATIAGDFELEELGPSLVLQTASGKPIILAVVDAKADQVKLALRSGRRGDVPKANVVLQTNFEAERKSLQKQRAALDDIRGGRAVSPDIGKVLSEPETAAPPQPAGLHFPPHLSDDKRQVLDKAMEVSSVLVVNGPPGTGKTTVIAELISSYLGRYPNRRILLSSQTHVALDHIIAKLDEKGLTDHVVRIVSFGSENVHKVSKLVGSLTLDRKVREWCLKAEERSERFIESLAQSKGIDAFEVKTELLGRSYMEARRALQKLRKDLVEVKNKKREIDGKRIRKVSEGKLLDPLDILRQTEQTLNEEDELQSNIGSLEARISRLLASLNKLDGLGSVFSDAKDSDLEGLLDGLVSHSEARKELLPMMQLHLDWINRLGSERSFHGAVLHEARIVAGTCIGLAGTPAFQQDQYDLCIVDEASKATATETLVPMSRSRRTILVGDPKQLPPYIESSQNQNGDSLYSDDAKKSLLQVLLDQLPSDNVEELVEQRRMCSTIGELVSQVFYGGKLVNIREDKDRDSVIAKIYPHPVTWFSTSKQKKRGETPVSGGSFENGIEVQQVIEQLKEIGRQTRKATSKIEVAIIAAYSAQVALLRDRISQHIGVHSGFSVEVNTVDAFQGREADVCIYTVTRSNDFSKIGFQRERERINVALSRARDALVIVGDADFCHKAKGQNPFQAVIDHIRANPDFCLLRNI